MYVPSRPPFTFAMHRADPGLPSGKTPSKLPTPNSGSLVQAGFKAHRANASASQHGVVSHWTYTSCTCTSPLASRRRADCSCWDFALRSQLSELMTGLIEAAVVNKRLVWKSSVLKTFQSSRPVKCFRLDSETRTLGALNCKSLD